MLYYNTSWQGSPLRAPVASLRLVALPGHSSPLQSQQTVSPVKHSRETSLSLHPSIKGAIAPPLNPTRRTWRRASPPAPNHARNVWPFDRQSGEHSALPRHPHDHFMETSKRAYRRYPSLEPSQRPKTLRGLWTPDQPSRGLGYANGVTTSLRISPNSLVMVLRGKLAYLLYIACAHVIC